VLNGRSYVSGLGQPRVKPFDTLRAVSLSNRPLHFYCMDTLRRDHPVEVERLDLKPLNVRATGSKTACGHAVPPFSRFVLAPGVGPTARLRLRLSHVSSKRRPPGMIEVFRITPEAFAEQTGTFRGRWIFGKQGS